MATQNPPINKPQQADQKIDYARFCQNMQELMDKFKSMNEIDIPPQQQELKMGQQLSQLTVQKRLNKNGNVFKVYYNDIAGDLHLYDTDRDLVDQMTNGTVIEHATVIFAKPNDKRLFLASGNMVIDRQTILEQLPPQATRYKVERMLDGTMGLCWLKFNQLAVFDCSQCPLPETSWWNYKEIKVTIEGIVEPDDPECTCILKATKLDFYGH